jgi:low temperature requirement protein LtrA
VGAATRTLTAGLVFGSTLALLITVGLWWTYFDRVAERAEARLREHDDPVLAAADGYSYIHLVIVAGIIIFDGGVKLVVHNLAQGAPMPGPGRLALCGGVAVYLLGLAGFRLRMFGEVSRGLLAGAAALFVLYALGGSIPAWTVGAIIAAVVGALGALETRRARTEAETEPAAEAETGPHAEAETEPGQAASTPPVEART